MMAAGGRRTLVYKDERRNMRARKQRGIMNRPGKPDFIVSGMTFWKSVGNSRNTGVRKVQH